MVDVVVSSVALRLAELIEQQIRNKVNLVRGVENDIHSLSNELNTIGNLLDGAERREFKDKSVKDWLRKLEDASYEMDDVLDEWNISIIELQQKVWPFIPSPSLFFKKVVIRHDIALKIKEVKKRLDLILVERDQFDFVTSRPIYASRESWRVQTTSLIDLEEVCGRDFDMENVIGKLVVGDGRREELNMRVISIVGPGGIGKTTLAKLAYNDSRVKNCFELRIWICVSNPFDEFGIANGIIEGAGGSKPNTNQLDMLLQCLGNSISGKKFLLVLDDVWTEDDTKWEPLKNTLKHGGAGSKILVTTRNQRVVVMMGGVKNDIHHLGHLSHDECWLLLGRIALSGKNREEREKVENIGKAIARKCKGLPLAAKTLGSLLRFKNTLEEWEDVLDSEIWVLEEIEVDLFAHLLLSYNELSPALKRCFSYCGVFPKDTEIDVEGIVTKWMSLGYLESNGSNGGDWKVRGREYFDKLAMRSLFQDFKTCGDRIESFKMHDILHDFARFLRNNGGVGAGTKKTSCQTCNPSIVSDVEDYRSLLNSKELPDPHLCDCLTRVRLLSLRRCGLKGIPKEIKKLIHLRWLNLGQNKFHNEDIKYICNLYNLKFVLLDMCQLQEVSSKIGNLIHLIHLDLSYNNLLKELPETLCNLCELETLNVNGCESLSRLPQGISRLVNLKHIYNSGTESLVQYPQGLGELTGLVTLSRFVFGEKCWSELGLLKNLNRLSGCLELRTYSDYIVEDEVAEEKILEHIREAELGKKKHIQELRIYFSGHEILVDALEPHPNLQILYITLSYEHRLPKWISSPLNQLKSITLSECTHLSSLPSLGKLPLLENFEIKFETVCDSRLEFVGREFLGITTTVTTWDLLFENCSSSSNTIAFPKLKKLQFRNCRRWREWEDITAEEEHSAAVALMPCLKELIIRNCWELAKLPHRLLRKASSLESLHIYGSTQLERFYVERKGQPWKSISISHQNPHFVIKHF
ncbi:hypothetical protein ABFX02_09G062000 [Erythranthe guttata]